MYRLLPYIVTKLCREGSRKMRANTCVQLPKYQLPFNSFSIRFHPGYSSVYQLLSLYDDLCRSLDNGVTTQAIFFDISKAFDNVRHRGLVSKLEAIGIRGGLLNWFKNYLAGRRQTVVIKGCRSDYTDVSGGVPQGSVLGPLLNLYK